MPQHTQAHLDGEVFQRLQVRARSQMTARHLDGLLVMSPVSVLHLTGFTSPEIGVMERPVFLYLPLDGPSILMLSDDSASHLNNQPRDPNTLVAHGVNDLRTYKEYPLTDGVPVVEWAARQIESSGFRGKRIGVEDNYMPVNDGLSSTWFNQFQDSFAGSTIPSGSLLAEIRMIKEPEEVELIRLACYYADELVRLVSERLAPGRLEQEIADDASSELLRRIRNDLGYDPIPGIGTGQVISEAVPATFVPSTTKRSGVVVEGVPIIINCAVAVNGYHGESETTGLLGTPTARQDQLFDIALESQQAALAAVAPGVSCSEVDAIAEGYIRNEGFEYHYGVGHGIGLLGHEPPWVRSGVPTELQEGMTVCIEPGLASPGEGSFHISQTVLVNAYGAEPLTTFPGLLELRL